MVSFAVQEPLSLIRLHLFLLLFLLPWETDLRKYCYDLCQRMFCLCSFLVLWCHLRFRSLNHFEFIFVYGVRECSNFIVLHVAVQLSQHHLLKRLSFLHCIFLPPLLKIGVWVYFWALCLFPLTYVSDFVPVPCCFNYCSFVV